MIRGWMVVWAFGVGVTPSWSSMVLTANSESIQYFNVDSVGLLGDAANATQTHTFVGGFTANWVNVSGRLTEVQAATFASEADVQISPPGGASPFAANGSMLSSYTGTVDVGPTTTLIPTPFDPAGSVGFEFFESGDEAPGADQTWEQITIEFADVTIVNGDFGIGTLPRNATTLTRRGRNVFTGLDFYEFTIDHDINSDGYLNIQTSDPGTGDLIDTEIGLYSAAGARIATDDDGQSPAEGNRYSVLTFGVNDPDSGDRAPGFHGASIPAGTYTLVVGGFNTDFTPQISGITGGTLTEEGDYDISFTYSAIPEPSAAAMIGVIVFAVAALKQIQRRPRSNRHSILARY